MGQEIYKYVGALNMLKVVAVETALEIIKENFSDTPLSTETVSLINSLGRVLSEDIVSKENIPAFDRSTVDGYALKASDTYGSGESIPSQLDIVGEILMGEKAESEIKDGECIKISTGGMLPEGADSVVMVENTDNSFGDICLVYKSVSPFENVNRKGDDIKEDTLIFTKGRKITSKEIGVLAALGISEVNVFRQPKVGIISTGDEIVSVDTPLTFGKIRDINSHILSALMREKGCETTLYGIVKDEYDAILSKMQKAVSENDIVLISGGSSAGARDMTVDIISRLGEVYLHGIAMKPGKPTIVGKIDGKAVFGLPGHPTAGYFVTLRLVKPLIDMMFSRKDGTRKIKAKMLQNISSNHGREEILCVKLTDEGAKPLYGKSGVISLLAESDGYIIIDRNCEGLKAGDATEIYLFQE